MNNTIWTINKNTEQNYKNFVSQCLTSEEMFKTFRRHEYFSQIISDCMPKEEQEILLSELIKYQHAILKFDKIKLMDEVGEPLLNTQIYGQPTSPRNLKYMYAASLIKEHFDNIESAVEIGSCYGGLCFTLGNVFQLNGYQLVDFDCVVALAKLFLSKLPPIHNIKEEQFFNPTPPYDIAISENAISELDQDSREYYYNKYVSKSKHLFMRTNFHSQYDFNGFVNLLEQDFLIKKLQDYPAPSQPYSTLLGWNKNL